MAQIHVSMQCSETNYIEITFVGSSGVVEYGSFPNDVWRQNAGESSANLSMHLSNFKKENDNYFKLGNLVAKRKH